MTAVELPFERAFRRWLQENGMGRERLELTVRGGEATTAYRFSPGSPPARRVLALHGAGNDALFAWIGLFKKLLLRHVEVFTFDLPGHGRFGRGTFDTDAAAIALHAALDRCEADAVPVHAIGVSLGGAVLLGALPDFQQRLTTAALVVAPLEIHFSARTVLTELGPTTFSLLWREREHYGLTGLIPSFGPFRRDIYPLRLRQTPAKGAFGYVQTLNAMLREMHLEESARQVELPVLLVYGSRDRVVPASQGERLQELLPRGHLQLIDGTHLSTPLDPRAVERLLGWIDLHGDD